MKLKIIKFRTLKSTNDKAIKLIQKHRHTSGLIISDTQTKIVSISFFVISFFNWLNVILMFPKIKFVSFSYPKW